LSLDWRELAVELTTGILADDLRFNLCFFGKMMIVIKWAFRRFLAKMRFRNCEKEAEALHAHTHYSLLEDGN
jgi:hypothetical protein